MVRGLFFVFILITIFLASCQQQNLTKEIVQLADGRTDVVTYKQVSDSLRIGTYSNGNVYMKSVTSSGFPGYIEKELSQYNINGNMYKYAYFLNDSLRYYRFYNDDGTIKDCGGSGLVYLDNETIYTKTFKPNEKSFLQLRMVKPPHAVVRIIAGNKVENEAERDFQNDPLIQLPIKDNLSGFLVDYEDHGQYKKVIYWSIEDTISNHIQKGRVWYEFNVVSNKETI